MYSDKLEIQIMELQSRIEALKRDNSLSLEEYTRQTSLLHHKIECRRTRIELKSGRSARVLLYYPAGSINLNNE